MKTKRTLRHKPSAKQKIQVWYIASGIALAVLAGVGLFFYLNLSTSTDSKASVTYSSTDVHGESDWIIGNTWAGGIAHPSTGINYNINISKDHLVFHHGTVRWKPVYGQRF
uniref:Uncharacterized protein n=1 Tax=Roseihalotalea indica TaxID=2867963 RepID=A0AA49JC81_9BACT|nr:hypothetical protein K4G66_18910 [Tunicatimonas sp. TK19036]